MAVSMFAAACNQTPTSPSGLSPLGAPGAPASPAFVTNGDVASAFAAGDTATSTPTLTQVRVCKAGNTSGTFTVSSSPVNGGSPSVSSPITVASGECRIVAEDTDTTTGVGSNITLTETSSGLQSISAQRNDAGTISSFSFSNGGTVFLNAFHGYTITFTNNVTQPPTTGNQGCSPGYWKQPQHADSWPAGYSPTDSFNTVFGIGTNWFPNSYTLAAALSTGGGGATALGRQAVAALLNAASGFYPLSTSQVISRVQATYAGTYSIGSTQSLFEGSNNNCPLN